MSGLAGSRDRSSQRCHKLRSRGRAALHHLHHHRPSVRYFNLRRWTAGANLGQIAERQFTKPLACRCPRCACGSRSSSGSLAMLAAMRRAQYGLNRLDRHLDQRSPLDHDAQAAIGPCRQVEHVLHGARPKAPP